MLITSLNNDHVKELAKLKEKKYRDSVNAFLVEGEHLVLEAYKAGLIKELILEKDRLFPINVPTTYVTNDIIHKISCLESPSDVMAVVSKKEEDNIGEKILILDDIQDPGNLGTIIRSAVAFNIDTVVLSKECVDIYNSKTLRSTKGMIFNKNVIVRDIVPFISSLDGYMIYGTDVNDGVDVREIDIPKCLAIVIGNEGTGISKIVHDMCDKFIYIKMNDKCESLNAGVASSIIMYEVNNR